MDIFFAPTTILVSAQMLVILYHIPQQASHLLQIMDNGIEELWF